MTKTLLLLRHAKSSWADPGMSDFDRPLNDRGKRDAPRVGEVLTERGIIPDLVMSSSAKRARKTAKRMLKATDFNVELRLVEKFYLAAPTNYISELTLLPDSVQKVLVVGHNPGIEELLELLSGQHQPMPTAALAQIELPIDSWSELHLDGRGKLVWFWTPGSEE